MAIRYMVQDDYDKALKVKEVIDLGAYIIPEIIPELIYALNKGYKVPRRETGWAISDLLDDVDVVDKNFYLSALKLYRESKLDYVDCVLVMKKVIMKDQIFTFDKELILTLEKYA